MKTPQDEINAAIEAQIAAGTLKRVEASTTETVAAPVAANDSGWKKAGKVIGYVAAVAAVGAGAYIGWNKYSAA